MWPSPESIREGTTQESMVSWGPLRERSTIKGFTGCLNPLTASPRQLDLAVFLPTPLEVPSPPSRSPNLEGGPGKRTPGQEGRNKNLLLSDQKFTLCIISHVVSIWRSTKPKQGLHLKKNPTPFYLFIMASSFEVMSDWNRDMLS